MSSRKTRSNRFRHAAPRFLISFGLGTIALGFGLQMLEPQLRIMDSLQLSGTIFGLMAKLGGAVFFGGLFALAIHEATRRKAPAPEPGMTPERPAHLPPEAIAAVRAARLARQRQAPRKAAPQA